MITRKQLSLFVLLLMLSACTTIAPLKQQAEVYHDNFSHRYFNLTLDQSVDYQGRVDYQYLKQNAADLESYYQLISHISPDSHPDLFPTEQHQLAYWINAYNAAVIKIVLAYYPIASIEEVTPPFPLFFLPDKMGFFFFQRPSFGNVNTSLYYLENSVIRKRFSEPRVHFALNCASRGCPRLPNYAFDADQLNQQLEQEARRFFAEPRNLRIDPVNKTVFMSSIMDWYEDDFLDWYRVHYPQREATLINYVALYLPKDKAKQLIDTASEFKVNFVPYDWRLNDQNTTD